MALFFCDIKMVCKEFARWHYRRNSLLVWSSAIVRRELMHQQDKQPTCEPRWNRPIYFLFFSLHSQFRIYFRQPFALQPVCPTPWIIIPLCDAASSLPFVFNLETLRFHTILRWMAAALSRYLSPILAREQKCGKQKSAACSPHSTYPLAVNATEPILSSQLFYEAVENLYSVWI